jgi:hypothetical protein
MTFHFISCKIESLRILSLNSKSFKDLVFIKELVFGLKNSTILNFFGKSTSKPDLFIKYSVKQAPPIRIAFLIPSL